MFYKIFLSVFLFLFSFHSKSQTEEDFVSLCGGVYYDVPAYKLMIQDAGSNFRITHHIDSLKFENLWTEQKMTLPVTDNLSRHTIEFFEGFKSFSVGCDAGSVLSDNLVISKSYRTTTKCVYPMEFTKNDPIIKQYVKHLTSRLPPMKKYRLRKFELFETKKPELIINDFSIIDNTIKFEIQNNMIDTVKNKSIDTEYFVVSIESETGGSFMSFDFIHNLMYYSGVEIFEEEKEGVSILPGQSVTYSYSRRPSFFENVDGIYQVVIKQYNCSELIVDESSNDPFGKSICQKTVYVSDRFRVELEIAD